MEIEMNSRIGISACAMMLLLDEFGTELLEKIEQGTVAEYGDIMAVARDKTVDYFNKHKGANDELH